MEALTPDPLKLHSLKETGIRELGSKTNLRLRKRRNWPKTRDRPKTRKNGGKRKVEAQDVVPVNRVWGPFVHPGPRSKNGRLV